MGIRFQCPNGHNIHVKTFMAGKRAKCPHCGAKVQIPSLDPSDAHCVEPVVSEATADALREPWLADANSVATPPLPTAKAGGTSGEDQWYVHHPSGGEYGPASWPLLQRWISEGRVPHDALVWCDRWPDWRQAADVLQEVKDEPPDAPLEGLPEMASPRTVVRRAKRRDRTVVAIALLSFASLLLFVILVFVLRRNGN